MLVEKHKEEILDRLAIIAERLEGKGFKSAASEIDKLIADIEDNVISLEEGAKRAYNLADKMLERAERLERIRERDRLGTRSREGRLGTRSREGRRSTLIGNRLLSLRRSRVVSRHGSSPFLRRQRLRGCRCFPYEYRPYEYRPVYEYRPYEYRPYEYRPYEYRPYEYRPYEYRPIMESPILEAKRRRALRDRLLSRTSRGMGYRVSPSLNVGYRKGLYR